MKNFVITFVLLMSCIAQAQVKFVPQELTNWCWAATTAMAYEYQTGRSISNCDVATIYHEHGVDCCKNLSKCDHAISFYHLDYLLRVQMNLNILSYQTALSLGEVEAALSNNKIIIIVVENVDKNEPGHVAVISRLIGNGLVILDPQRGQIMIPYHNLIDAKGRKFTWVKSIIVLK